jgi:hypothetical protein
MTQPATSRNLYVYGFDETPCSGVPLDALSQLIDTATGLPSSRYSYGFVIPPAAIQRVHVNVCYSAGMGNEKRVTPNDFGYCDLLVIVCGAHWIPYNEWSADMHVGPGVKRCVNFRLPFLQDDLIVAEFIDGGPVVPFGQPLPDGQIVNVDCSGLGLSHTTILADWRIIAAIMAEVAKIGGSDAITPS